MSQNSALVPNAREEVKKQVEPPVYIQTLQSIEVCVNVQKAALGDLMQPSTEKVWIRQKRVVAREFLKKLKNDRRV